jgi:hypothetical protein
LAIDYAVRRVIGKLPSIDSSRANDSARSG